MPLAGFFPLAHISALDAAGVRRPLAAALVLTHYWKVYGMFI
jgi:hypothetical protein